MFVTTKFSKPKYFTFRVLRIQDCKRHVSKRMRNAINFFDRDQ